LRKTAEYPRGDNHWACPASTASKQDLSFKPSSPMLQLRIPAKAFRSYPKVMNESSPAALCKRKFIRLKKRAVILALGLYGWIIRHAPGPIASFTERCASKFKKYIMILNH
jgi:hypothetical protein